MSPTSSIANQLRQLIYYNLDNESLQNALFLAGRLHALDPRNPDAAHLLALSNFRLGRLKAAYDYSRDKGSRGHHLGCAYIFAQACLGLERYSDGISALEKARGLWGGRNHWNKHSELSRRHFPDAAAVNCLLGKLWRGHCDVKKAVEYYVEALKQNPFMWDAFLELCDTGAAVRTSNLFKLTPEMQSYLAQSSTTSATTSESYSPQNASAANRNHATVAIPVNDPFNPSNRSSAETGLNLGGSNLLSRLNEGVPSANMHYGQRLDAETPTTNGGGAGLDDDDVMMGDSLAHGSFTGHDVPPAPVRKTRTLQNFASETGRGIPKMKPLPAESRYKMSSEGPDFGDTSQSTATNHKRTISGHVSQAGSSLNSDPSAASQRRSARIATVMNKLNASGSKLSTSLGRDTDLKEKRDARKAVRATGTKGRVPNTSTVGRVVSGNRKPMEATDPSNKESRVPKPNTTTIINVPPPKGIPIDTGRELEALQWLLDLLSKIGHGYFCLSRYQCMDALQVFSTVPFQQRETPWVLAQMAKAHYENQSYVEAEELFKKIRNLCPSRMEDMEMYSTVLWHLRKETDLAYLAHELIEVDRLSPEAWCTIGNSFSLQREHDQAVKCFKRATQLDPQFAYAFSLQGHEYVANEEYDKALYAYRCAISADARHYNGWYGLGKVYEKMGKYEIAEKHYKAAVQINPTNAVLVVRIGVVLDRMKSTSAALTHFTHACTLDPKSALSRFKRAHALIKLQLVPDALKELEILKDLAPDEANVHFMLGRVYKILREKTAAIRHFTIALNLDPKAAQYIKEAMETMEDEEEDDYEDDNNEL